MAQFRTTALVTSERADWGGSYHDSFTHAKLFKSGAPFNFGVKVAQPFSSDIGSHLINKRFTWLTIADGNAHALPGGTDDYTWYVGDDRLQEYRITELLVDPASQPGKGNMPFKIAADKPYLHEPAVIKLGGYNLPLLRILGQPIQRSANSWEYEVVIQDGDPNTWIPVAELQPEKTFVRYASLVSDELNQKFGPDQYGDMYKLQSWVSNYANKAEFTDKFIRQEIAARKSGGVLPKGGFNVNGKEYQGPAVSAGYVYQVNMRNTAGKLVEQGVFITNIEARLEERTMMDRENIMEEGRLDKTVDLQSGRPIKVAPGWRQMAQEGQYMEHNGSLNLSTLANWLNNIFLTRNAFGERKVVLSGGEAFIRWFHTMVANEYSQLVVVDSYFVDRKKDAVGVHRNELTFGAQFTEIALPNGLIITVHYDPKKDDRMIHRTLAPGTNYTLESYAADIFDFGQSSMTPDKMSGSNMTMVYQDGVESLYQVSNVYNFETGAITDGSNAYSNNKEAGIYKELSGSLCIWDIERVGRLVFNPY